jgi:hypothetical protein
VLSVKPACGGGEVDAGEDISSALVAAGGGGTELLKFAEAILD